MAFNFNWSPLTADASFYTRAQELLTVALNKSPKPPIIVDEIRVNELNLGSIPPDLEILEIGDLAEDRFRGIFKMCYTGDAFLTLKTRVQANPLNTYLSTKPSFTSPQPLAAASGLTIPIQITLSEIKLSAFIILVFSRQKGITLVFRNDPLESLKVSSTFDAIPFVREYLQKEIESQLRTLLMDELPVIIHRLSLRLFVPEYKEKEDQELAKEQQAAKESPIDPLASPPQDAVDVSGNLSDPSQIALMSPDSGSEMHALFSQKNLLRLGALTDSHKTLSLFTPTMRDTVFRAWAGPTERGEFAVSSGKSTPATMPPLVRAHTYTGSHSTTYTISDSSDRSLASARPKLSTSDSVASGLGLGSSRTGKPRGHRKKHRIVNLRKKAAADSDEIESVSGESTTASGTMSSATSEYGAQPELAEQRAGRPITPPDSPDQADKEPGNADVGMTPPRYRDVTPRMPSRPQTSIDNDRTPRQSQYLPAPPTSKRPTLRTSSSLQHLQYEPPDIQTPPLSASPTSSRHQYQQQYQHYQQPPPPRLQELEPSPFIEASTPASPSGTEANAWMTKMASMIAQKVQDQKAADSSFWSKEEPPPAYKA